MTGIDFTEDDSGKVFLGFQAVFWLAVIWAIYRLVSMHFGYDDDSPIFSHFLYVLFALFICTPVVAIGFFILLLYIGLQEKIPVLIRLAVPLAITLAVTYFALQGNWKIIPFTEKLEQRRILYLWDSFAVMNLSIFLFNLFNLPKSNSQDRVANLLIALLTLAIGAGTGYGIYLAVLLMMSTGPDIFLVLGIILLIYPTFLLPFAVIVKRIIGPLLHKGESGKWNNFPRRVFRRFQYLISFPLYYAFSIALTLSLKGFNGDVGETSGAVIVRVNGVVQSGSSALSDGITAVAAPIILLLIVYMTYILSAKNLIQLFSPLNDKHSVSMDTSGARSFFDKLLLISEEEAENNSRLHLVVFKIMMVVAAVVLFGIGFI